MLFLSMLLMGGIIGFVGAGGGGVIITLLVVGFGVPIHQALAVALGSMAFTTLSGAVSHYREGEVVVKTGVVLGMGGFLGALVGAVISNHMQAPNLSLLTGVMLLSSAFLLYLRIYQAEWLARRIHVREELLTGSQLYLYGLPIGFLCGVLSGAFGIGSAAYIQIALMVTFGVPLLQAIGTTMMIIVPIAVSGGIGYVFYGQFEMWIFLQTLTALSIGSYCGAKLTHLAPRTVLRFWIVALPSIGGLIMICFR
ncbi:sulfite exporter TauE/SafE family protein [Selenomonas sp. oral taxon 892]|uniref:sulfite exporter TauE/SafE family protein n=1 Tax=Selenomonas sp. oral taxon 892 TaxID=1321785 RepID=UPI0003F770C9|nr:sulfite exporter TauE/SafE family protein [Selenomonas sp. oral taxon 892]